MITQVTVNYLVTLTASPHYFCNKCMVTRKENSLFDKVHCGNNMALNFERC